MLLRIAVAGALAALVAGCGPRHVTVYGEGGDYLSYFEGDFEYATRKGAIRTEVVGLPFQTDPQRLQAVVLALMSGRNFSRPADFVPANSERTDPPYKVMVAFNMAAGHSGYALCRGAQGLTMRGPGNPVTVHMAFCFGDQLKSDVYGRVGQISGFDDPKFAELIHETLLSLHPLKDYQREDDNGTVIP